MVGRSIYRLPCRLCYKLLTLRSVVNWFFYSKLDSDRDTVRTDSVDVIIPYIECDGNRSTNEYIYIYMRVKITNAYRV